MEKHNLTQDFLKNKVVLCTLSMGDKKKIFTVEYGYVIKTWGGSLRWAKGLRFESIYKKFKQRGFKLDKIKIIKEF